MEKDKVFEYELSFIKDNDIRESARYFLNNLPDYFYEIPASSTGKYHPKYSLGQGGLVRHVKGAFKIAVELLNNPCFNAFTEHERDLIYMAIMLHDGLKKGLNESCYTTFDHPIVMAKFILDNKDNVKMNNDDCEIVARLISSHMGPWHTNKYDNTVLPIPKKHDELFVHMCDYLASRKCLNIEIEEE